MTPGVPAGWPAPVAPPQTAEFTGSAVAWLLDLCPSDVRAHPVLQRHPAALAHLAAHCVAADLEGVEAALRTARATLDGRLPPDALLAAMGAYESERRRLQAAVRGAGLVAQALRGVRFAPRL